MLGLYLFFRFCVLVIKVIAYTVAAMVYVAAMTLQVMALLLTTIITHTVEKRNCQKLNQPGPS